MISSVEKLQDNALVELAASGDNEAFKELSQRHSGICVETYKKYINFPNIPNYISEELINSKDYVMFNSARSLNPEKGAKFSTWLANQVRFFCLNSLNKELKKPMVELNVESSEFKLFQEEKENKSDFQKLFLNENGEKIRNLLKNYKNKKIKECIYRKYFDAQGEEKTFTQVAKEMNVTVQTVINWHGKFIKLAKARLKKLDK